MTLLFFHDPTNLTHHKSVALPSIWNGQIQLLVQTDSMQRYTDIFTYSRYCLHSNTAELLRRVTPTVGLSRRIIIPYNRNISFLENTDIIPIFSICWALVWFCKFSARKILIYTVFAISKNVFGRILHPGLLKTSHSFSFELD